MKTEFYIKMLIIPTAKQRPRFRRFGRNSVATYTPRETMVAEDHIKYLVMAEMKEKGFKKPLEGPIRLFISNYVQIPTSWSKKRKEQASGGLILPITRPDVDNYAKLVMDALNGILWIDDSQVFSLTVEKRYSNEPCVTLLMTEDTNAV